MFPLFGTRDRYRSNGKSKNIYSLGGKAMKTKRWKQANYAIGDFLAGFGKAVIRSNIRLRHLVKASSQLFKPPLAGETQQVFPGDSVCVKVPGSKDTRSSHNFDYLIHFGLLHPLPESVTKCRHLLLFADIL